MLVPFHCRALELCGADQFKMAKEGRVPESTPHNAALHISPKMWSSTSYDGSGLWVCAKRLERGRFGWPTAKEARSITMRPEELAMLVNGLDLTQARPRKNWMHETPAA
jgi:hypothetical protein